MRLTEYRTSTALSLGARLCYRVGLVFFGQDSHLSHLFHIFQATYAYRGLLRHRTALYKMLF